MAVQVKTLALDRINGYRRTSAGVYVPDNDMAKRLLEAKKISPDKQLPYKAQGDEVEEIEAARSNQHSVLIVGPTGTGKTRLARHLAQKWGVPYLKIHCNKDMTDGKVRGSGELLTLPVEIDDRVETLHVKHLLLRDVALAGLAGLADMPVVLCVEEIHAMREGITTIFHPMTNDRYLDMTDITGEDWPLHPETVLFFLGNNYADVGGGIERVTTPMRRRLKPVLVFDYPNEQMLLDIVLANLPPEAAKGEIRKNLEILCKQTARMCQAWKNIIEQRTIFTDSKVQDIGAKLTAAEISGNVLEAPSPDHLIAAGKALLRGRPLDVVIKRYIAGPLVRDFGAALNAVCEVFNIL